MKQPTTFGDLRRSGYKPLTIKQELRKNLAEQKASSPKMDVGRFKELTGVSRKYAIPLLEYLDRERVTKRIGDERVIL